MNNLFLHKRFTQLLEKTYHMPCHHILLETKNGEYEVPTFVKKNKLVVGILFEKTSFSKSSKADMPELVSALINYAESQGFNEVRLFTEYPVANLSNTIPHKVNMVLDLPEQKETLWKAFKPIVRNRVRRPEKEGFHYIIANNKELVKQFHGVYLQAMHNLGSLCLPLDFFENLANNFSDEVAIYVGYLKDKPVCAAVMTDSENEIFMPWAGSLREYNRFGINMAMYWHMIEWAIDKKRARFNFGRSTRGGGTYTIKKKWLTHEQQLYQYHIPIHQESASKAKLFSYINKIIQQSPVFVMQLLSQFFLKRFY